MGRIVATVLLIIAVVLLFILVLLVLFAVPAKAEGMLYCTETASRGFNWHQGSSEGAPTIFKPRRFVVKVVSPTERKITSTVGEMKGAPFSFTCRRPSPDAQALRCTDELAVETWIFKGNSFVSSNMLPPPTGPSPFTYSVSIAYGTCAKY